MANVYTPGANSLLKSAPKNSHIPDQIVLATLHPLYSIAVQRCNELDNADQQKATTTAKSRSHLFSF